MNASEVRLAVAEDETNLVALLQEMHGEIGLGRFEPEMARQAVRAGIELLLREFGCDPGSLERVLIAGSFGYHLRAESLLTIGLLPPQCAGKVEFVGNTSKSGGEAFLLNSHTRRDMAAVVAGIGVLELANCPDFDRVFVRCLSFAEVGAA